MRFDEALDLGSAIGNVVLEWWRADGGFEGVPALVIGEGDRTLRVAPLDDLMDGVVDRARVVGGLDGVVGPAAGTRRRAPPDRPRHPGGPRRLAPELHRARGGGGHGPAPALVFDHVFLRVGSGTDGVPVEARALGHRIARGGETFTAQNFPVPDVIARYRGDVAIAEPAEPLVEAFGEQFFLSSLATAARRDEDAVAAFVERLGASDAVVVVALLPPDVLRLSGFHDAVAGGSPRVVGIQISADFAESDAYGASTLAHASGHAFGLHHATACPEVQPCVNGGQSDAIDGFRIAASSDFGWK